MSSLRITATLLDVDDTFNVSDVINVTTTNDALDFRRVEIGTGEETHTIDADIGDCGYCFLKNRDATNFVQVGFATTVYNIRLLAGQVAVFPLEPSTSALYLKADTAACEVDIYIREV